MIRKIITPIATLAALAVASSTFSHTNDKTAEGVDHAKQDTYWAEKAKDYPAFDIKAARASTLEIAERPVDDGAWGPVISWPHIPVTAANLPDGRILTFASNQRNSFPGGRPEFTYAATWNPVTNQFQENNHSGHDMFCGHLSTLEDGRIFINGGRNHVKTTTTFDYRTNTWQTIDQMNRGRWYPTTVALPTGSVLTAIGSSGGEYPELWTEGQGWKSLTGASLQTPILSYTQFFERNWWPLLHVDPRGKVFHSGPTPKMHSIETGGLGSVTKVGPELNDWYPKHGATVMYDEGKLLVAGGAVSGSNTRSTNKAMIIDIRNEEPIVTQIPSMNYARKFQNGVMLPTGEVLIVGGNSSGGKFNDSGSILPTEIWNPETNTWRVADSISVPRNYHSIALLLTDGRVLSAGGGLCNCAADHSDGQVYTPPYLYNNDGSLASRPTISNAPNTIKTGFTFSLQSNTNISKFSLIKMSATTHGVNTDLRYLKIPFTHDGSGNYQLTTHSNKNVLTPGNWMLFAVNDRGVPSVAKIVNVSTTGLPVVEPINTQTNVTGQSVSLSINASDPLGQNLSYQARQLPPGLSINSSTGFISGQVTTRGTYSTRIIVSNSDSQSEIRFTWIVYPPGSTPGVSYEYFHGDWNALPNFDLLTPVATGNVTNFDISQRTQNERFGFRFSSLINISQAGTYTFYTRSDDGSRLWVDGNLVVDNDGLHPMLEKSGQVFLSEGQHSIVVGYFEKTGGEGLTVQFSSAGMSKRQIPNTSLIQNPLNNVAPDILTPSNQVSSSNSIVDLSIIASDINGDNLTYSASGLPNGLSINTSSGKITGTTTVAGGFVVTVTVNDGQGESSSTTFDWQVIAPISISPIQSPPKLQGSVVNYSAVVSGGTSLRYRWNFGDSQSTTYSSSPSTSHRFSSAGTYVVTLFVQDGSDSPEEYQFTQAIFAPLTSAQATHSSSIALEERNGNDRIWVVNPDNDTVTAYDSVAHAKIIEISVGKKPHALAFAPNGRLWVVNKDSASISIIDTSNLVLDQTEVAQTVSFKAGSQPHGLAFATNGTAAYLVLEAAGELKRLNPSNASIIGSLNIGSHPRHVSVNADNSKIFVSRFITPPLPSEATENVQTTVNGQHFGGEVLVVNSSTMSISKTIVLKHSESQDAEHSARGVPNYLGPVVISPDGNSAWVASKQDNIKRGMLRDGRQLTHDSTVRSISSKINLGSESENLNDRVDHDNGGIASTSIFSKTGNYLFVALEGSREIAVVDAYSNEEFYRFSAGRAPQGLALSEDGMTLFSHNFMDRSVTVHDISRVINERATQVPLVSVYNLVSNERLSINVLNGKQMFYDARDQRLAREQYISCASCHNEGDSDGRVWDFTGIGEGLRNTIGLVGHGGTDQGPLHWTANFDEVQDFEGQIRDLSGGLGLMQDSIFFSGTHSTPLGDSKTGDSQDLDDLAAYVASLKVTPISPNKNSDGTLTSTAQQGKTVFVEKGCNSCHSGQHFTDSADNNLHNVGSIRPSSGRRLNSTLSGLDTPTLRGLWLTAPYLHNGSASTILDAIAAHTNVSTTNTERSQLSAYLSQLDRAVNNVTSGESNEVPDGQITVNGNMSDWNGISAFSNDPNDVSGTNNPINIDSIHLAHDSSKLHILYRNHGNVDPSDTTGTYLAWGWQLYMDTDNSSSTGYKIGTIGADYIIEGNQIQRYNGSGADWLWIREGEGPSAYQNNIAEISIDRALIANPNSFKFVFMGINEAYGGNTIDLYPDNLDSAQGSDSYFEYNFNGDTDNGSQTAPIGTPQNLSLLRDSSIEIQLQGTDEQNDPLTYSISSAPNNGIIEGTGQNIRYVPNNGFTGTDSFSFIANDGIDNSAPATITLTIRAPSNGVISNPVINITVDGNANDWSGITRFTDDPDDVNESGSTIDWQNVALAHSSQKLFMLYKNRNIIENGSGNFIPWGWQAYLDIDSNFATGYQTNGIGADYVLEGNQLHAFIGNGTDFNLADPVEISTTFRNDAVEISIDRSLLNNPTQLRVVFLGNNEAYEGTELDYYPDLNSSPSYFSYSLANIAQVANRAQVTSRSLSLNENETLEISLGSSDQQSGVSRVVAQPSNGVLSGNGTMRVYTPNSGFTGTDQIKYIVESDGTQSSIATITLDVMANTNTDSENSESGSGGGSLPMNLLVIFSVLLFYRKLKLLK